MEVIIKNKRFILNTWYSFRSCICIQVFAVGLRAILMDTERVEGLIGQELDHNVVDYVRMLAECLYHVLTATSYSKYLELNAFYDGDIGVNVLYG